MNWLSFLIGVLVGLIIAWLIYLLFLRPRRAAAEADLRLKLDAASKESASLKARLATTGALEAQLKGASSELDSVKAELAGMKDLQTNLDACQADAEGYKHEIERLDAELAAARASVPTLGVEEPATRAPAAVTLPAEEPEAPDDLRIVEGIGPVISGLLNKAGIYTFAQLASTSIERLRSILDAGGPRFRIADPETWPAQAVLARDGNWDALKALQEKLKAGRRV